MSVDLGVASYLCGLMLILGLICTVGQMRQNSKK